MIIKSQSYHKPGDIVTTGGITDNNGKPHLQPFMIIDMVTIEDYVQQCRDENISVGMILSNDYFYRISVD